jgi:hypothetical protein
MVRTEYDGWHAIGEVLDDLLVPLREYIERVPSRHVVDVDQADRLPTEDPWE